MQDSSFERKTDLELELIRDQKRKAARGLLAGKIQQGCRDVEPNYPSD